MEIRTRGNVCLQTYYKVVRVLHHSLPSSKHCCLCLHGNCTSPGPYSLAQRRFSLIAVHGAPIAVAHSAHRFRAPAVFATQSSCSIQSCWPLINPLQLLCCLCVHSNATILRPFLDTSQIQRRCPPIYNFLPPCHLDTSCACITPRLSSSKHRCLCLHSNYTSPHLQPSPTPPSPGCRVPITIVTQSPCSTQLLAVKQSSPASVLLLCKQ